jgi:hypothetical protein
MDQYNREIFQLCSEQLTFNPDISRKLSKYIDISKIIHDIFQEKIREIREIDTSTDIELRDFIGILSTIFEPNYKVSFDNIEKLMEDRWQAHCNVDYY